MAGHFLLGSPKSPALARAQPSSNAASANVPPGTHPKLTLEQMKQMADAQASTLIEKSKADPKNAGLLIQIVAIYQATHQFKEAANPRWARSYLPVSNSPGADAHTRRKFRATVAARPPPSPQH